MDIGWDDLRLFLDVARLGGLSAATATTRLSAATLGRRVTALEKQIGEPLFVRQQTGYRLTPVGEELLRRAEDVEAAMQSLTRWREGTLPDRIVRVSAGPWTSAAGPAATPCTSRRPAGPWTALLRGPVTPA